MDEELRRGLQAELAKAMAMFCVRNTKLEDIHAGIVPVTRTGDSSDVTVIGANGRRIAFEASQLVERVVLNKQRGQPARHNHHLCTVIGRPRGRSKCYLINHDPHPVRLMTEMRHAGHEPAE